MNWVAEYWGAGSTLPVETSSWTSAVSDQALLNVLPVETPKGYAVSHCKSRDQPLLNALLVETRSSRADRRRLGRINHCSTFYLLRQPTPIPPKADDRRINHCSTPYLLRPARFGDEKTGRAEDQPLLNALLVETSPNRAHHCSTALPVETIASLAALNSDCSTLYLLRPERGAAIRHTSRRINYCSTPYLLR
jgi:hypothetical protein